MSRLKAFLLLVALSAAPSAAFVGLCRGLERLQDTETMDAVADTYGVKPDEVTLRDAARGALGPGRDADPSPFEPRL